LFTFVSILFLIYEAGESLLGFWFIGYYMQNRMSKSEYSFRELDVLGLSSFIIDLNRQSCIPKSRIGNRKLHSRKKALTEYLPLIHSSGDLFLRMSLL
jgi:hypothetical protein